MQNAPRLTKVHDNYIIFALATNPKLPNTKLLSNMQDIFGDSITRHQIEYAKKRLAADIQANIGNTEHLLKIATETGALTLHNKLARLALLEDIAYNCAYGYATEIGDPGGGLQVVTKKEYRTAIDAIKQIREEVGPEAATENTTYNIVVEELKIKNIDEPLPGDEEL